MADIYTTPAVFKTYHEARGRNVDMFGDDAEIDAAGLVASEWIDGQYRSLFPGTKVGMRDQVREWPRVAAYDVYGYAIPSDSVPVEIINATCEAQYKQLVTPGSLLVDWTPSKYKSVSISGAVSVQFASFDSLGDMQTRIAIIAQILAPILTGNLNGAGFSGLSGGTTRV